MGRLDLQAVQSMRFRSGPCRAREGAGCTDGPGAYMSAKVDEVCKIKEILGQQQDELAQILRKRDDIAIEKSADQMDEIQYASERDLAIRNVDRETRRLREVVGALRRIGDGTFGECVECGSAIGPKRLAAVPWASRCINCQEAADRNGSQTTVLVSEPLADAA